VSSIGWTGHRPDLFLDQAAARAAVDHTADDLFAARPARFLVGGQRGVDTWAAQAAHRLGVPFTLVLPLPVDAFAADWSAEDRQRLELSIAQAAELRVIGGPSPSAAYTSRNRVLATAADLLVAVWTGRAGGGTAETLELARQAGTPVREVRLPAAPGAAEAHGRGL
jgi:hypothetical protein